MSYQDGWSAINLEMPPRVPRTEYSAHQHWELVHAATGQAVNSESPEPDRQSASSAFVKAWNYDFFWSILTHNQVFGALRTRMGHAEYAAGGVDYVDDRQCPFKGVDEVFDFDPARAYGQIDQAQYAHEFERHYRENCRKWPGAVNMTGIYITCISGLLEIFGWDMMLLAMGEDPMRFGAVTNRYAAWIQQYFDALALTDIPVVMVHDDITWTSGPFTRPAWYRHFVFPHYRRFFAPLIDTGKKIIFTSDGNYTEFIDDVALAGAHGFVMEPTTDMALVAEKYGQTHVFIGNVDTRILLEGDRRQIHAEVERCMAIGKECPGFFLAVGNHIPANTPVESAIYYNEVYNQLSRR
jgi:hypothetical protein